jgi:hypothetical protein
MAFLCDDTKACFNALILVVVLVLLYYVVWKNPPKQGFGSYISSSKLEQIARNGYKARRY